MDLIWTDEQQMLRRAVHDVCEKHSTTDIVRALEDDPVGFRREMWDELARMDLCGLLIPEEFGGIGGSMLDVAVVYEEFGRALASSPHWASAVLCATAILLGGTEEQKKQWLPKIATGEVVLAPASMEPDGAEGIERIATRAEAGRLTGTKMLVPFASSAAALLVVARDTEGVGLWLVEVEQTSIEQTKTMAADASYLVTLDGSPGERVGTATEETWERALTGSLIPLAAYAMGGAQRAHELAVDYAKERVQFGKPIGSFQGVAHPLAEMAAEIEGGRILVYEAAWAHENGRNAAPLAAMAKLFCADVFRKTSMVGQQTFGGIGFTREVDMQLYFRRAKQLELLWGEPAMLEELIAAAELDAPEPYVTTEVGGRESSALDLDSLQTPPPHELEHVKQ